MLEVEGSRKVYNMNHLSEFKQIQNKTMHAWFTDTQVAQTIRKMERDSQTLWHSGNVLFSCK
jgi:hypothetical protein